MINYKFCIFILSYGRPENIKTLATLKKANYTGDYYIVCSDDDKRLQDYKRLHKEKVIIFNKDEIGKTFDVGDNFGNKKVIIYARNMCFKLARQLGYDYFLELDDDYTSFEYRKENEDKTKLLVVSCKQLDRVINAFLKYMETTNTLSICMAQGGDFIGGVKGTTYLKGMKRKAMNTFFCKTDRPFTFVGSINEDVNTYTTLGRQGNVFLTNISISIHQLQTQKTKGGMSDTYLDGGTYLKSFYTTMYAPSCAVISSMGHLHRRIHHRIRWDNAVVQILDYKYKKGEHNGL